MKISKLLTTALALGLAACTVTVDEGNPPPRPDPRPRACPRIYQPVCATRYGEQRDFSNSCVAQTRGFVVLYGGECRERRPISEPNYEPRPLPPRPRPNRPRPLPYGAGVVCPSFVAPVCARQGGVVRTFQNACIAQGSGFRVVDDGPC
jgi:hypothetical protein